MYETFEHTADLGLRIRAATLPELLAEAGRGLLAVLVADPASVKPVEQVDLRIDGSEPEDLFFDWLAELLFVFDAQRLLLAEFQIRQDASGVSAIARGQRFDPALHELDHAVKAITYHGLRVVQDSNGWLAEVIVDL